MRVKDFDSRARSFHPPSLDVSGHNDRIKIRIRQLIDIDERYGNEL